MNASPNVSTAQIGAQLEAVLQQKADAAVVAIRASMPGAWPESIQRNGRAFRLRWCESRLALREALTEFEARENDADGLIVMTPLGDSDVPVDVAARLARAQVFQPRGWEIVRQIFGAKETDARLGHYEWIPEVLIDSADAGPYAPVPGGFLDLETAWREVLARCLYLDTARPDAAMLMQWAQRTDLAMLLEKLPLKARTDVLQWLGSHAGVAGALVVRCVEAGRGGDAAPLGLVCGALFDSAVESVPELAQAAVRIERYVGDQHVPVADGRAWAKQAQQLIETTERTTPEDARAMLDRADSLMRELRVGDFAWLSNWLPNGMEQRLAKFAQALTAQLDMPGQAHALQVEQAADAVTNHRLAGQQAARVDRVRMATRLVRWLTQPPDSAGNLAHHIEAYADNGAFVDWARLKLLGGDELQELSAAYAALRFTVAQRREQANQRFATALAQSLSEEKSLGPRIVQVESLLHDVVGRLAQTHPVLLLVADGLSVSIFRELFERPERHGWVELTPEAAERPLIGLTAFPTITDVSRTSLLCGRIAVGAASNERTAFAAHSALLACSNASHPPKLFHKADLSEDGGLSPDVRSALANPSQKIVGVVYNAIDDHLHGPEQLHQRWNLDDLRLLLPLLREARDSRRVVIVTADHGHTLEQGSVLISGGTSDRWRVGTQTSDPREIVLTGKRVLTPDGAHQAVCIWSEGARYTGRKNGYHGGASPAEAVVPLSVFAPSGVNVVNWKAAPPQQPEWWDLPAMLESPTSSATPMAKTASKRPPAVHTAQQGLFGDHELPVQALSAPEAGDWVSQLLDSPLYASQRQLAARVALPSEQMRALLVALDERGGKLTRSALAQRLAVAEMRLSGMMSVARRMLNIDQAAVLKVDEASGTVELNRQLLLQQFRILPKGEVS